MLNKLFDVSSNFWSDVSKLSNTIAGKLVPLVEFVEFVLEKLYEFDDELDELEEFEIDVPFGTDGATVDTGIPS